MYFVENLSQKSKLKLVQYIYRRLVIINRALYIFHPIFQYGLQSRDINITDNLCTKQVNLGVKSAVSNHEQFQIKILVFFGKLAFAFQDPPSKKFHT